MTRTLDSANVGVLGAGTMGSGIAQIAALNGHETKLYDNNPEALSRARATLESIFTRLVEKRKLSADDASQALRRIAFVGKTADLSSCAFIIEAVIEDLQVKRSLLAEVESVVAQEAILATNTSSLSVAAIASSCDKTDRVIGAHFFNPAPLMPLVEIVPGVDTSETTIRDAREWIDAWGKTTVIAKDTPGFIVNRVARPFYGEALRILEEGVASAATIDWAMRDLGGFRMGPFELMDFIGNDVNLRVTETIFESFYFDPRYRPSFTQKRMVEAGRLGRKTGRGFFSYGEAAPREEPSEDRDLGERIFKRILVMLINEAADALFWRVASRDDLDLAMTKGVNYPKGLLRWADETGLDVVFSDLQSLYENYCEDRYRPSPLLRRMARKGRTFY